MIYMEFVYVIFLSWHYQLLFNIGLIFKLNFWVFFFKLKLYTYTPIGIIIIMQLLLYKDNQKSYQK